MLLQLAQQVGRRLRQQGLRGRTVRLKLRMPDFQTTTRQCRVAATQDDLVLFESATKLLDGAWDRNSGIRLLGVTAADLVAAADATQGSLFGEQVEDQRTRVLEAMDAIRDRHGEQAVRRGPPPQDASKWGPGR